MLDLVITGIPYRTTYVLLFVLGILLIVEILIFAILLFRSRGKSNQRELVGITLDTAIVKRSFTVGNEFDCSGLIVQANYNVEPSSVNIADYVVLAEDELNEVKSQGELNGCYVVKPDMNEAGKTVVTVLYLDKTSVYSIEINEAVEEDTLPESAEESTSATEALPAVEPAEAAPSPVKPTFFGEASAKALYNKSFKARLIQSSDEVKQWYSKLKNELLSYKKVKDRLSWHRETFRWHRNPVAKFAFRGKTLCVFLPLNVSDYVDKYKVEDASRLAKYIDTPLMIRLKNNRRLKIALLLVGEVMKHKGVVIREHQSVDYSVPYEGTEQLIKKGLIKQ